MGVGWGMEELMGSAKAAAVCELSFKYARFKAPQWPQVAIYNTEYVNIINLQQLLIW
jgi:hypothetical protein